MKDNPTSQTDRTDQTSQAPDAERSAELDRLTTYARTYGEGAAFLLAADELAKLRKWNRAAYHALQSYRLGNASPDLAEEIVKANNRLWREGRMSTANQTDHLSFDLWWERLRDIAVTAGLQTLVTYKNKEAWRGYWEDDYSPGAALAEDLIYAD